MAETQTKPKRNMSRSELLALGKQLGLELLEESWSQLIEHAKKSDDPEGYMRQWVKLNQHPGAPAPVRPTVPQVLGAELAIGAIMNVPLATLADEWHRFRQVNVSLAGDADLREVVTRLYHGLRQANARLRPRREQAGEPPRVIESVADAIKWLLQELAAQVPQSPA